VRIPLIRLYRTPGELPPVLLFPRRKPGIRVRLKFNGSQNEPIGKLQRLSVQLPSTDDDNFLTGSQSNGLVQGSGYITAGDLESGVTRYDYILPSGQGATYGLPGFATHYDRLSHGRFLEMPEFTGQVPWQVTACADRSVAGHGSYDRDFFAQVHIFYTHTGAALDRTGFMIALTLAWGTGFLNSR